jgi:RNA polymerase sigma-70 factor (ECF subfamily)
LSVPGEIRIGTYFAEKTSFTRRPSGSTVDLGQMSDRRYLGRLKKGDQAAWQLLLREWQGPLYQYFSYALPDPSQAEEALCATMDAAIRAIPKFDGSVSLSTFLYSLASQRITMAHRQQKASSRRRKRLTPDGSQTDAFRTLLNSMPQRQRQALLLRFRLGLSVTEIAEILGLAVSETERMLVQGSRHLNDALGSAGYQ